MAASFMQKKILKRGALLLINRFDTVAVSSVGQIRGLKHIYKRPPPLPCVNDMAKSIAQKGYLRAQDSYTPPENVAGKVRELLSNVTVENEKSLKLNEKFALLTLCASDFGRAVPSSFLHEIKSIDDVIAFYETPVNAFLPLDELRTRELPPNLHIQHEYVRFHPDTDTKFNGQTAFPKSSTIVTGLKYRKKYPGFQAKQSWP